ncbi:membrane integrity-associated transporter subunit PqiC [Achromobacter sp. AONIH1]|uniref:PqiC family protein n=1 Tax=Achromobacter sp. AONIH1 TaxID=1758194 RepID=UPI0026B1C0C0
MNMTPMPFFPRIATSALALAAALAGCASAPVHYYTLSVPAGTASAPAGAQAAYMIDVLPVSVPTPADQPQLMVRNGDGSVSALYSERWTAPLADEVRGALSDALQRELGALDVRVVKPASSAAVWRVQTDVQRFDLSPGAAQLDATWRVRPVNLKGSGLICRTVVDEPASGQGASALVAAQQRALSKLAGVMASAIRGRQAPDGEGVRSVGCAPLKE